MYIFELAYSAKFHIPARMKTKSWQIISTGGILGMLGVVLCLSMDQILIPQILAVIGIEVAVLEAVRKYLYQSESIRTLGITIVIFSILNFLRHATFFNVVSRIGECYEHSLAFQGFLLRETVWLLASLWILSKGVKLLGATEAPTFGEYVQAKEFKILARLILLLLILEIPLVGIHGDFGGGLHGHGFWEIGMHLH